MILVFGSLNIDLVAQVPVIPGRDRTVLSPSYQAHFGGNGRTILASCRVANGGLRRNGAAMRSKRPPETPM